MISNHFDICLTSVYASAAQSLRLCGGIRVVNRHRQQKNTKTIAI